MNRRVLKQGRSWYWLLSLLLFSVLVVFQQAQPVAAALPGRPQANFYDQLNILDQTTKKLVSQKNITYDQTKQRPQIMLATIKSTDGDSIDSYAPDLFAHWGLGQRQRDNGVLILYALNNGKRNVRIEVGYGLESELTDALSGRILQQAKADLKSTDATKINRGLRQVFNSVATVIDKKYDFKADKNTLSDEAYQKIKGKQESSWTDNIGTIIVILILVLLFMGGGHGRGGGGLWWLWALLGSGSNRNNHWGGGSGGFGGGDSGGFGGFSGGGGSSGGGGASI
ncbi:TPM domain-containing protein [Lapidilactobacillus gannanensis]|uniref:TPM domain-containing protein n=1 Tax=Lapidilactobacillus gannanensis TaxID=2486002 RepID=A0ABW4BK81_9LACO